MDVPWDHILQLILTFLRQLVGGLYQLGQQATGHFGMWGKLGLHLLVILLGCWMLYQLFRVILFILLRIIFPLMIVAFAFFLLILLTS